MTVAKPSSNRSHHRGGRHVTDVHQASAARSAYRESVLRSVPCPTLVTASRQDGGVAFAHSEDFVRTIPDARLVETQAPSHFYWLGASRLTVSDAVRDFLTG
jgi:pimeloyl-ACP methyl ester carboxylesterase